MSSGYGKRLTYQESAKPTLLVSHLYTLDHAILTLAHYLFFEVYWYQIPHDGRRTANSQAQIDLINLAASRGEIPPPNSEEGGGMDGANELRIALAQDIWRDEKVYAGWALVFGWLLKVSDVPARGGPAFFRSTSARVIPRKAGQGRGDFIPPLAYLLPALLTLTTRSTSS